MQTTKRKPPKRVKPPLPHLSRLTSSSPRRNDFTTSSRPPSSPSHRKSPLVLANCRTLHVILDESDRLLSADFLPQIEPILTFPAQKTLLSATIPSSAETIARTHLHHPVRIVVGVKDSAVTTVAQSLLYTGSESGKILALQNMLSIGTLSYPSLIFTQSIERADELYRILALNIRVEVVHGNKSKAHRDSAISAFRNGDVWVLVVTEVLARGMDFRGVKVVINYGKLPHVPAYVDLPQTVSSYIHRIGRTGRAGRPGKAVTFFTDEDKPHLRTIANVLRASGCDVPGYMLDLPKPSKNERKQVAKVPVKREEVGGAVSSELKGKAKRKLGQTVSDA